MFFLSVYHSLISRAEPLLKRLLEWRMRMGKEDRARIGERMGTPGLPRPEGKLIWIHAASVGEAQSAQILINVLLERFPTGHILVTTGTVTSAAMLRDKLPKRCMHQFAPLDHPQWIEKFMAHWKPDLALWIESELWPETILQLGRQSIPAALVNARLSDKSFRLWKLARGSASELLASFSLILAQTERDAARFKALDHPRAIVTDNLKYSAKPLPASQDDLHALSARVMNRPCWLYASSHRGEEDLAARVHATLKSALPDLLTIIVPRHPARRDDIMASLSQTHLKVTRRGSGKALPEADTDLYLADTMGELGLFYRLAPLACIGRSFSLDGGGGHNPVEAAQLNCAVLYGPHVQYQQDIFAALAAEDAARQVTSEAALANAVLSLLTDPRKLAALQSAGMNFCRTRTDVVGRVMRELEPLLKALDP